MKFSHIVHNFGYRSFFFKCLSLLIVSLLVPFLIFSYVIWKNSTDVIRKSMETSSVQSLYKTLYSVDELFKSMDLLYTQFYSQNEAKIILLNNGVYRTNGENIVRRMSNELNSFVSMTAPVSSIYFYNSATDYVVSTSILTNAPLSRFDDTGWYERCMAGETLFARDVTVSKKPVSYLTYCRPAYYNNDSLYVLVFNIDIKALERSLAADGYKLSLFLKNNVPIYPAGAEYDPDVETAYIMAADNAYSKANISGLTCVSSVKSAQTGLVLVTDGGNYAYAGQIEQDKFVAMILTLLIIAIAVFITILIVSRVYGAIVRIVAVIKDPLPLKKKNSDEISFIISSILSMMNKNDNIENKLAEGLQALTDSQTAALQAQLTPHFLFNTLQLITSIEVSRAGEDTDVTKIVGLLSELLYFALESGEYIVTLKEELRYCRKYLDIQNVKYQNSFDVHWDISEETLPLKVVKLSLQPIIENAINHGLAPLEKKGNLYISSRISDGNLFICIKNDGIQLTAIEIARLRNDINKIGIGKTKHFGLSNVNQRIKLIFGPEYYCDISNQDCLTVLTLKLPAVTNGKESA